MGFLNPYVGLKRDTGGYYLDYADAAASPFYKQYDNAARLSAANKGGRVDLSSFDPYASQSEVVLSTGGDSGQEVRGTPYGPIGRKVSDSRFKGQAFGRADQQFSSDQEVARIQQQGRDQTKQAQLSSEISYAQDAARRASQDTQAGGTSPAGPDVQLSTSGSDAQDGEGGDARRRRQSFGQSGAGLKI